MNPRVDLDEFPDSGFSAQERQRLRRLLQSDDRAHWFWTTTRTWVIWIGGVATALAATKLFLADFIKGFIK